MERKTAEAQSKNCGTKAVGRTSFSRTELDGLDDPSVSGFRLVTASVQNLKRMYIISELQNAISLWAFVSNPEQPYRTKLPFLQSASIHHHNSAAVSLMTRRFVIFGNCHGCERLAQRWRQWELTVETVGRFRWEPVGSWLMAMEAPFLLHERRSWWV